MWTSRSATRRWRAVNSTYNLNGGTLNLSAVVGGDGGAWDKGVTINFGGGTLRAGASFTLNINSSVFTNSGSAIDTAGYTLTVSKPLSGTGGFAKTGTGTLVLSGSNTFSGAVSINGGTLLPKHAFALGTGDLTLGGGTLRAGASFTANANTIQLTGTGGNTVIDTQANTLRIDWPVFGAGGFTKVGSGTLDLRGSNTFGGPMTITEGKVEARNVGALGSGALTVAGGTLDLTPAGVMAPSARDYSLASGAAKMKLNSASPEIGCDLLQGNAVTGPGVAGTFTFVLNFGGAAKAQSKYRLMTASSFSLDTSRLLASVENGPALTSASFQLSGGALYVTLSGPDFVDTYQWNVTASSGNWDKASPNWKQDVTEGLTFSDGKGALFNDVAGQPAVTVSVAEPLAPATLVVNNSATAYTFAGANPLTVAAVLNCAGTNAVNFAAPVSAATLTLTSGGSVTLSQGSLISNAVAIPQNTTLTVSSTNALAGGFTVAGGSYPNQSHLRFAGGPAIDALPASLNATYSVAKTVSLANGYGVNNGQTLRAEAGANLTMGGQFSLFTGTLRIEGGSVTVPRLVLGDAYSTAATVLQSGGTLTITGTTGTSQGSDGGNQASALFGHWVSTCLYSISAGTLSVEGALLRLGHDGDGSMTILSNGLVKTKGVLLDGSSLNLNGGTLEVGSSGVARRNDFVWFNFGGGTLKASTNFTFAYLNETTNVVLKAATTSTLDVNDRTVTFLAPLSGSGSLTVADTSVNKGGALNLNATNTFTGALRVNSGTVNLNAPGAMTGLTVAGGLLNLGEANASLASVSITGGTVVPKHASAFGTAAIGLAGGTLNVRASGAVVPAKTLNVSAASTLMTACTNAPSLSVGTMTGVLSLDAGIAGATTGVEYKLLSATATPAADKFSVAGAYGDKKAKLLFKSDGVYFTMSPAATLMLLR